MREVLLALLLASLTAFGAGGPRIRLESESPTEENEKEAEEVEWELSGAAPSWRALWEAGRGGGGPREPQLDVPEEVLSVPLGTSAQLHCRVRHLADRGISWVRRRDWHIISSGIFMYTNDERFQVLHNEDSDDWTLQIKYVQKRDNGTYECQVSTGRGIVSRLVHLFVSSPSVFILGAAEQHVGAGSALVLVCVVEGGARDGGLIWSREGAVLPIVGGGMEEGSQTRATLAVPSASPAHSGNYTCRAPHADPASVLVFVEENSDKMAATLSRESCAFCHVPCGRLLAVLILVLALVYEPASS